MIKKLLTKRANLHGLGWFFLTFLIFASGCKDDEVEPGPEIAPEIKSVNNYIWDNMDLFYLWREYMPTNVDPDSETDPRNFFDRLLYKVEDRWSYITDDYKALINSFSGIEKTFGINFALFRQENSKEIFGVVEYTVKGSPAYLAGIRRSDVFVSVDGTRLDSLNFRDLLFNRESYLLGFAEIEDGEVVPNGETINLTAVTVQENPVLLDTVIEIEGRKIGYLVYTQFISDFKEELKATFAGFKFAGIQDLIVDLRYNPGGSVSTATLMASMIAPASVVNDEAVFSRYIWNDLIEQYWQDREGEDSRNLVIKFNPVDENLNLNRVFFIVTGGSASASETLINGLMPYMDITLVGQTTHGKYTGSITLHDEEESFNWAIQPIVLKTANVDGDTEFKDGFAPDIFIRDDLFSPLGSPGEGMLAQTLSQITGIPADQLARKALPEIIQRADYIESGGMVPVDKKKILYIDNLELN